MSIPAFHGGQRKFEKQGAVKKEAISRGGGVGVASRVFFPGAPSKIDVQAISYLTINRCFKAKFFVFIDDLLFAVG